jgi:hypothetical protein
MENCFMFPYSIDYSKSRDERVWRDYKSISLNISFIEYCMREKLPVSMNLIIIVIFKQKP